MYVETSTHWSAAKKYGAEEKKCRHTKQGIIWFQISLSYSHMYVCGVISHSNIYGKSYYQSVSY